MRKGTRIASAPDILDCGWHSASFVVVKLDASGRVRGINTPRLGALSRENDAGCMWIVKLPFAAREGTQKQGKG